MIENISLPSSSIEPTLFSSLRQNTNNLSQTDPVLRKQSIKNLYNLIITHQMPSAAFQEIVHEFLKAILTAFSDQCQQVRQHAVKIVIELMIRCQQVDSLLPYLMTVLIERLNCADLEGIKNIPQAMRPPPGQKPKVVLKLVQTSDQVRLSICKLVQKIIGLVEVGTMRKYIDEMVNCIRALVMDPSGEIQLYACNILATFCATYKNILLHYTQALGRSILLPLISKKSKIRIAALNALNKVLECGLWKYNAFVFQNLIGFKDPNSVAIKQFYEPSFNVNYLASLIVDGNAKVREAFMNCLHFWICVLDDKYDHHPKLVPYVLSGLFDQQQRIREIAFNTLEEIGQQIQKEKYAQFKDYRQYGMDSAWTWQGKLKDLPLPDPFKVRPREGSRFFVKGHVRKMWPAIFREIKDINIQHRKKAVDLALMGIIYAQQSMTSHLDKFIPNFVTSLRVVSPEDAPICKKVEELFYYLGRYCPYSSYIHIIKSGITGELVKNEEFIQSTFKALSKLMQGSMQAIPPDTGLCHKKKEISDLLNLINQVELFNYINQRNCREVEELVTVLINGINTKGSQEDKDQLFGAQFIDMFKLLMISLYQQEISYLSSLNLKQIKPLAISQHLKQSLQTVHTLLPHYVESVSEELQSMFSNPPSLNQANFKFLIGLYVYNLFYPKNNSLTQLTVEIANETLSFNKIPLLVDFLFKLTKSITASQVFDEKNLSPVLAVLSNTELNFSKFKSYRKAPVYQQQKQYSPEDMMITQQYVITIFKHLTQTLQALQQRKVSLIEKEELLSDLLYGYIKVVNSFRKIKELAADSVRPVWAILERTNYKISIQRFKHNNEYLLPLLIDYLIERVQTIQSGTQMYNLSIATLSKLFELFPTSSTALVKLPMHYPDYSALLSKLFKYCLNEKDIESKQKLKKMLGVLAQKTKDWFQIEYKEAANKGMHERVKLLEQIMR